MGKHQVVAWILFASALLAAVPAPAAGEEEDQSPSDQVLVVPDNSVIGKISIRAEDLFDLKDPKENRRAFRWANHLHKGTRERVIRQQLLFESGEAYSDPLLAESERVLRSDPYIYDSRVRPVAVHDGVVDVEVVTRDVWTLNAGVRFGRAGGAQSTAFRVEDTNLLGSGKHLALEHRTDVDRVSDQVVFRDPNLLGSRVRLEAQLENNSDGSASTFALGKPFESLESRWAAGLELSTVDQVDSIYSLGLVTDRFEHRSQNFEISGGLSKGLRNHRAIRWNAGLTYQEDTFQAPVDFGPPSNLPEDRTLVYPWIGIDSQSDAFETSQELDNLGRTEDIFLGSRFHARLGLSSSQFGSDRDAAIFDAGVGLGRQGSGGQSLFLDGGLSGRLGGSGGRGLENGLLHFGARYHRTDFGAHQFFASLQGALARNLDADQQVLLGGDSGLRGYPLRYQAGEAKALLTLEQRFFTDWYPWRLFHVGAAVFFDAGQAWGDGPDGAPALGLLKDIGVGLRLGSSRSSGSVVHFDVAFPLDGNSSIRGVQWLIKSKNTL